MGLADYRSALVTGASSGIGAAMTRALTGRGLSVTAVARRRDRLDALAEETGCTPLEIDLRDRDALYASLSDKPYDILVNNAGLGVGMGPLFEADPDDIDTTSGTNVTSALHVLRAVVPGMVERQCGHIVNIGSVAGLYPMSVALYGSTKGAIHQLSQNLRLELSGTGVRVTEICPGRVGTEFFEVAHRSEDRARKALDAMTVIAPSEIADTVIFALDAPWHVNISTIELNPTEQAFGGMTVKRVDRPQGTQE
jgi:NADP-dependent 3-hydroxy acid dehydrogenase YdfG